MIRVSRFPRSLALLVLFLGACQGPPESMPAVPANAPPIVIESPPERPAPLVDTSDGSDWLRLSSGEWIKGKIITFYGKSLLFKSSKLGELKLDFSDVLEIRTSRTFTVLVEGREEFVGVVHLLAEQLSVTDDSGTIQLPRSEVYRLVPGEPEESNFWSGRLAIGGTARRGNTDQLDYTLSLSLLRRTARSRLPIDYSSAYGELEGQRNTDNQRLAGHYDWFLGKRLFVTPLGLELYRDHFQNIDLRTAPYAGLGYKLVDNGWVDWDTTLGLGYRRTRYVSVPVGQSDTEETSTGILGTKISWEPTADIHVAFTYAAQIGLENTRETNQSAGLDVSMDLWWDFDLDVRLAWNRVGAPQLEDDGTLPKKDDYQLTVGLSWDF